MSLDLQWWGRLAGLLATEATLVVATAWLAARGLRSPQMQRAVWQAALLGIALLWVAELAGARGQLARWLPAERPRRTLSVRVLDAPHTEPVTEPFLFEPTEAPLPTVTPPRPVWWPGWLWLIGLTLLTGRLALSRAWLMWCVWRSDGGDRGEGQRASASVRSQKAVAPRCDASALQDADASSSASDDTGATVARLRRKLGLRRVRLLVWPRLRGPVAFGVLRPTVALPEDFRTRFSPAQCEAMLAHELAHLAARDPLWLTLADLVCASAWWHPAVWLARRQLRSACESAADEAAALVPDGRAALAESLVTFGRELASPRWARGIGVAGDGLKSQLARRVKVLLHASDGWCAVRPARMWATRLGATGVVAALVLAPWPGVNGAGLAPLLAAVKAAERTTLSGAESQVAAADKTKPLATVSDVLRDPQFRAVVDRLAAAGPSGSAQSELHTPGAIAEPKPRGMTNAFARQNGLGYEIPAPVSQTVTTYGYNVTNPADPRTGEVIQRVGLYSNSPPEDVTTTAKSVYVPLRLSDGSEQPPGPVHTDKARQLHTRRFDLPAKEFTGHLTRFLPQLGARDRVNDWQRAVRGFFLIHGVEFPSATAFNTGTNTTPLEEKALFFNDRTGVLFLRATLEDLDRAELAIQSLDLPTLESPPGATPPLKSNVGQSAAAGGHPAPAEITGGSTGNDLRTREFRLSAVGLDQTFRNHLLYFLPAGETDLKRRLQSAVRSFCYVNGVELPSATVINPLSANANGPTATPTQDPKSAFFNNDTGVLFVRATVADIDRIERAIQSLGLLTATNPTSTPSGAPDGQEETSKPEVADTAGLLRRYESALQAAKQADLDAAPIFAAKGKDSPQVAQAMKRYRDAQERVQLFEEVIATDKELESLRTRYKDGHPKVRDASARRSDLMARIGSSAADTTLRNAPTKAPAATPQIALEVRFAEITERGSDDLGLDWLFGQSPTNNPALQSGPATNLLTEPGSPSGRNLRVDLLRTEGQSATLTDAQFAALRKRLESRGGVEFLAAPRLVTESGRQARVAVSDMRSIVSGVDTTRGSATNQIGISYQTEQIATGPSVDLIGTIEGGATRLAIVAKVTEFLGYDQPKPGQEVEAASPGGKPVKGTTPLPHLRVRSTQADVSAGAGETVVLRGPLVSDTVRMVDKVVGLGDLPLLGRLFRTESTNNVRKRLYVFVTPTRVSATGERQ